MSNFIENQNWRYATKKFDTTKKVSSKDLETLKEAVRLSVSSYGLQLYKVIIIEDEATKKKLVDACWVKNKLQKRLMFSYSQILPILKTKTSTALLKTQLRLEI